MSQAEKYSESNDTGAGITSLEGKDDDLALVGTLHAGLAVRLEGSQWWKDNLILRWVLPHDRST